MSKIKAVIFDFDGTLVDTNEWVLSTYEHTLSHHGLKARSRAEIASQVGKRLEECYAFLAPGMVNDSLLNVHRAFQKQNAHLMKLFGHCNEVLGELSIKYKLALFTSRWNVALSLEAVGIDTKLFSVIVDADMVEKGKPDPEGIYKILDELGLKPTSAVMVGDAGVDIIAAKAAGLAATVGIIHGFGTREELEQVGTDYIIDSLDKLPAVIKTIEQS
ncbi:pyrophosphatase PpaX [soil metagenome]